MKTSTKSSKSGPSCHGFASRDCTLFKGNKSGAYYAYTLWLFTFSDLKTTVLPVTLFGFASALSGPLMTTVSKSPTFYELFSRLPAVLFATWLQVLVGTIANQRLPSSIVEDSINKNWRPIPAGLLSEEGAMHWLLIAIPAAIVASLFLGGTLETLTLIILIWMVSFAHSIAILAFAPQLYQGHWVIVEIKLN
jgi:4-hydroxybenzoate polyprenyltransferase